jgi:hypothetical protein
VEQVEHAARVGGDQRGEISSLLLVELVSVCESAQPGSIVRGVAAGAEGDESLCCVTEVPQP